MIIECNIIYEINLKSVPTHVNHICKASGASGGNDHFQAKYYLPNLSYETYSNVLFILFTFDLCFSDSVIAASLLF